MAFMLHAQSLYPILFTVNQKERKAKNGINYLFNHEKL